MMLKRGCRCPHHIIEKVLILLMWVAAVAYFWASWNSVAVWGFESGYHFQAVIVLGFLAFLTGKACGCCGAGMCAHGKDETCEHCK